ncbi:HTH-type transcriptional regulator AlkS [compost metagenome]
MHSRLHLRDGHVHEAISDLEQLEDLGQQRGLNRVVAHALAERVRLHLTMGDGDAAAEALAGLRFVAKRAERSGGGETRGKTSTLFQWMSVRYLAWQGRHHEARAQLQSLTASAPYRGQRRIETQLMLQQALLEDALGHPAQAMATTAKALHQCRELGLVRSFLDHGPDMRQLAERTYDAGLLSTPIEFYRQHIEAQRLAPEARPHQPPWHGLESLSERELDILQALASAMPNKRIALALGISPETVKWHLKNVYGKLGVSGRDGAVSRARDLGWITLT